MHRHTSQTAKRQVKSLDVQECLRQGTSAVKDETGIDAPKTKDVVWWLLKDALLTIEHLPDRESRWLSDANMSHMPEVARRLEELFEIELERLTDGIEQHDKIRVLFTPSQLSIDRCDIVLPWLRWHRGRKAKRDVQTVHLMAKDVSPARIAGKQGLRSRQAIYHAKDRVIQHIVDALRSHGHI